MELTLGIAVQGLQMLIVLALAPGLVGLVRTVKSRLTRRQGYHQSFYRDILRLMREEVSG